MLLLGINFKLQAFNFAEQPHLGKWDFFLVQSQRLSLPAADPMPL